MSKINQDAPELINAYINEFDGEAKEMLQLLHSTILESDPKIVEDWKWGAPSFAHKGLICWLVKFKDFVGINFYKGALIQDTFGLFIEDEDADKGNRIVRFKKLKDINQEAITYYVSEAVRLNVEGISIPKREIKTDLPDYLEAKLNDNPKALQFFNSLPPGAKRDYIEWITEAKREATRDSRMETMMQWCSEGKKRHWKYEKC